MTVWEYGQWARYYGEEPFGDVRADLRVGVMTSAIVNHLRGRKHGATKPIDFMPVIKRQQERGTTAVMLIRQGFEGNLGTRIRRTKIRRQ